MNDDGLKIQAAGLSDKGLHRSNNQDSLSIIPELGLFIVADGMGGHSSGEVASRQAIETAVGFLRNPPDPKHWLFPPNPALTEAENLLVCAIKLANHDLRILAREHIEFHGMGTTFVGALVDPDNDAIVIAHVGDSRCYRLRQGRLEKLTLDHSWVEEALQRGTISDEEARTHRFRHVLTRALGHTDDLLVDVQSQPWRHGDVLLMCSDGLTGMVEDRELERLGASFPDLEQAAEELLNAANNSGGKDNISLILVRILDDTMAELRNDETG